MEVMMFENEGSPSGVVFLKERELITDMIACRLPPTHKSRSDDAYIAWLEARIVALETLMLSHHFLLACNVDAGRLKDNKGVDDYLKELWAVVESNISNGREA